MDMIDREKEKKEKKELFDKEIEIKKDRNKNDLKVIIGTPEGRRFLWRLIKQECRTFACSYDKEHSIMAFNEGKRMVGASLVMELRELKPTIIEQMINEEQSEIAKKVKKK